ncbi:hypothetical protein MMSR116_29900 [Methylobacterium mesophilicum SR1.6/6]|uniref:Uncharacterized protein n=1 Tax=Methylobacterium mesophilicum SR1.6/6 TaxID=908290 RepID=A0A6B9FSI2_9HYPH|nr:hypothetical protein [Methylobacterium mesophilicum]QGY05643.1 hypothetical protein MMSR116_29900 [Methylobacterium mesophilicum SR1.6/6]
MSHFPTSRYADRTSLQLKAEIRESSSSEVWAEIEAERQAQDERTKRLRALRRAREHLTS